MFEVAGVSATAALYRRDALMRVSPLGEVFEPSFFAYYEDVDLSLRLARAGWRFACDGYFLGFRLAFGAGAAFGASSSWSSSSS